MKTMNDYKQEMINAAITSGHSEQWLNEYIAENNLSWEELYEFDCRMNNK